MASDTELKEDEAVEELVNKDVEAAETYDVETSTAFEAEAGEKADGAPSSLDASEKTEAPDALDEPVSIEDIEVEIAFRIGRKMLTVMEMRSLAAGYVFDLDSRAENGVTVLANGKPVGRGEIVQVGERLGVRLLSLCGDQSGRTS